MNHLMHTYNPLDVYFTHGKEVYLYDEDGKKYLDAMSGIAVTNLGHNHPIITAAIQLQASKLLHTSNVFQIKEQKELGNALCAATQMENVYFCNSGAEANEAAIKLTRLFANKNNIKNPNIIVMQNAFHGRTMSCISAGGAKKYQQGFEPLLPGFIHTKYNDITALEKLFSTRKDLVAIMLEPIQGESGINIPHKNYLKQVRNICDKNNCLMILDEVQTGMGRTGSLFNFQQHNFLPDILTSAKALGNGIPIGACLAKGEASTLFTPGKHGSTFGGNPFACSIALAVLNTINKQDFLQHVSDIGSFLLDGLKSRLSSVDGVNDIRGHGLMIAIELNKVARPMLNLCLKEGLLATVAGEHNIRLLPPLIIQKPEAEQIIQRLANIIPKYLKS